MSDRRKAGGLRGHLRRWLGIGDARPDGDVRVVRERVSPVRRGPVPGGRLSLVGLGELRAHLGERWPALSDRVHSLAEAVIGRHLSPGDVFDAHGDDGYIVLFSQLTKAEADFKCRVIAKEIAAKLLGSEWERLSVVGGISIELERGAIAEGDFDRALAEAVARGVPFGPEATGAELAAPRPSAPDPARSLFDDGDIELVVQEKAEAEAAPRTPASDPSGGYEPIWDFRALALLHFRLTVAAMPREADGLAAAKADVASVSKVSFDLGRLARLGRRLPVVCPVHYTTLDYRPWRLLIVRLLKEMPAPLLKVVALEVMVGEAVGKDWPRALDALARELPVKCLARVGPGADLARLRSDVSFKQVNLDLPADFADDKQAIAGLDRFARQCEAAGVPCGVIGLRSRALTLAASAAGFGQMSGPAVHPEVPALGHAVQFDLASLYRDLLPKRETAS